MPVKQNSTRRRSVRAVKSLSTDQIETDARKLPRLGKREDGDAWHAKVKAWWHEVWRSPVASHFDRTDHLSVWELADVKHRRLTSGNNSEVVRLSAEERQMESALGLSPKARQQMKVEIDRGDAAERRTRDRKNRSVTRVAEGETKGDPRSVLSA